MLAVADQQADREIQEKGLAPQWEEVERRMAAETKEKLGAMQEKFERLAAKAKDDSTKLQEAHNATKAAQEALEKERAHTHKAVTEAQRLTRLARELKAEKKRLEEVVAQHEAKKSDKELALQVERLQLQVKKLQDDLNKARAANTSPTKTAAATRDPPIEPVDVGLTMAGDFSLFGPTQQAQFKTSFSEKFGIAPGQISSFTAQPGSIKIKMRILPAPGGPSAEKLSSSIRDSIQDGSLATAVGREVMDSLVLPEPAPGANDASSFTRTLPAPTERNPVERWEREKNLEKKVETLKKKLEQKTEEMASTDKQWKHATTTLDREKKRLEGRVKELEGKVDAMKKAVASAAASGGGEAGEQGKQQQTRIHELEEEVSVLSRQLNVDKAAELKLLQRDLQKAQERADIAEQKLAKLQTENATAPSRLDRKEVFGDKEREKERKRLQEEIEQLKVALSDEQDKLLLAENKNNELRFDREMHAPTVTRLQRRVAELEAVGSSSLPSALTAATSTSADKKRGVGASDRDRNYESVIDAMKRAIEKLQAENDQLKKNTQSNMKFMKMVEENKDLKRRVAELEAGARDKPSTLDVSDPSKPHQQQELADLRKRLKKQTQEREALSDKCESLSRENLRLQELASQGGGSGGGGNAMQVQQLMAELQAKDRMIEGLQRRPAVSATAPMDITHATALRERAERAEAQVSQLKQQLASASAAGGGGTDEAREKEFEELLDSYEAVLHENKQLQQELDEVAKENESLKAELNAFEPEFFEEIEDLKFRYNELVRRCDKYEEMLVHLSGRYGFPFKPLSEDD